MQSFFKIISFDTILFYHIYPLMSPVTHFSGSVLTYVFFGDVRQGVHKMKTHSVIVYVRLRTLRVLFP
jgi:hypothetical protein